jgi:UDP-2,4-diacetamido-2,4,6-trideoxy-beta-L-altropyranose hydrolase
MSPLRVIFRVDASIQIGSGHVMRCLTLADALRRWGADCQFICREHEGNLIEYIRQRGFATYGLAINPKDASLASHDSSYYARWLGTDWATDAEQSKVVAGESMFDWLIVDHYALDARWEHCIRPLCRRIMVIDDIANRPHLCDVLLDQNYEEKERYVSLVPQNCRLLLGPSYALLRPEYSQYRALLKRGTGSINSVLVFFGGSDSHDLTSMTLKALCIPELNQLKVDLVLGASYANNKSLSELALLRGKTQIHRSRAHLADLMASADMGIGAGGVTNWERMCLGLPSIVVAVAKNQIPISENLHRKGVIRYLGKSDAVTVDRIANEFLNEIRSRQYAARIALSMTLCDGLGVSRVLSVMAAST